MSTPTDDLVALLRPLAAEIRSTNYCEPDPAIEETEVERPSRVAFTAEDVMFATAQAHLGLDECEHVEGGDAPLHNNEVDGSDGFGLCRPCAQLLVEALTERLRARQQKEEG